MSHLQVFVLDRLRKSSEGNIPQNYSLSHIAESRDAGGLSIVYIEMCRKFD